MHSSDPTRRHLLLASLALPVLPILTGCAAPLPALMNPGTAAAARALLDDSAAAHGLAALAGINDLNLRYVGTWRPLIDRLQPALADEGFRGGSEERLLLREGVIAQAHAGPSGRKQVLRRPGRSSTSQGDVRVWFNGDEAFDADRPRAAAVVIDGYSLFLLGPMLLAQRWAAERSMTLQLAGVEYVNEHECDVLRVRLAPGFGFSASEQIALFIDRRERLMRRVRFSLDGLPSTVGAIAEVETFDHVTLHGVRWPTRFYERLLKPLPLPVHDWRLTGLDVNRGLVAADVSAPGFSGKALAPAAALTPGLSVQGTV